MNLKIPHYTQDGYKAGHKKMYPQETTLIYSNWTPRGSRIKEVDKVVFFGAQYFIKEYLIKDWNENFFQRPKDEVVKKYVRRLKNYLGKDCATDHIENLHDLGYLPIAIYALPEGDMVDLRVPMMVVFNTLPEYFWLSNAIETLLSNTLWLPCTSATTAVMYRRLLDSWAERTGGDPNFVQFQAHDFSMRGHGSLESACTSGAGHLLSFVGTDTIPAIDFLEEYYNADCEKELVGCSVDATEHSVACVGSDYMDGVGDDFAYFYRMITEVCPTGIVSLVSDTFDLFKVIDPNGGTLVRLKEIIEKRNGKVVIRPDSGDPVKIVTGWKDEELDQTDQGLFDSKTGKIIGEVERKGLIQCLYEIFGGTINKKGYIDVSPCISGIYGDSITLERADKISERLADKGFSSTNIVYGVGSFTYQGAVMPDAIVTRDVYGFAQKATYAEINGTPKNLYKDPVTDDGLKKSARGLVAVYKEGNNYVLKDEVTWDEALNSELKPVFRNGKLLKDYTLQEVRDNLAQYL